MSKVSDSIELELTPEDALEACRRAVSDIGWRVLEEDEWKIVVKEVTPQSVSFTWAAKVTVSVFQSEGGSLVQLEGKITAVGPIQKGHLKGQLGALRNKIRVAAGEMQPTATGVPGIAGEIERLDKLRAQGLLSDEEFDQAKTQLLKG